MMQVQLPDGSIKEYPDNATSLDVAESIGPRLAKACIAAVVNGKVVDLKRELRLCREPGDSGPVTVRLLTDRDPEALGVLRHSAAHVMARAVMRLFPNVGLAFGPTLSTGFYYDFDMPDRIREEDFPKIEAEIGKLVAQAEPFDRFELPRSEAIGFVADLKQELKAEHIQTGLADHPTLSFYRQGEFVDLCRGPHIPDAGRIKAVKLLSVAASHFKGDAGGKSLQRLYGTAFFTQKDLDAHLAQVEEAKRRDHRVLGKQHALFHISQEVGPGLCLWLPKGATVRGLLEDFIKAELLKRGYQPVYTPHIGRVEMYETSGHFPYYRDSQFSPIFGHPAGSVVDRWITLLEAGELTSQKEKQFVEFAPLLEARVEGYPLGGLKDEKVASLKTWQSQHERYLLKPMNCPHHVQIYKSQQRSYRDLPVRLAEFGTVYRHEQSGELNGMLRVRGLTQDDAHQFCTPEQVENEFRDTVQLVQFVLGSLGLDDYRVQLSLRDPKSDKYVGSDENWQKAEASLRRVLEEMKLSFEPREGEAAFYGPKADFMVRDCIGREWQLGTVQLDYNLPERFQLEYIGTDNRPHRPVMIHRAPFGSMERFVGVLIEHFAAAFPLWLAPEQIRILPISEKFNDYAAQVEQQLKAAGFRATTDLRSSKINGKVRDAQLELIPYMLVVGREEAEQGTVTVRDRLDADHQKKLPLAQAIAELSAEVHERRIRQKAEPAKPAVAVVEGGEANEY
ncbi:MAG: threonine--tRNA ligase [Planctomycetaceae bacterium]|nr:threonine--tRNA ligase [Planctomycetaceae bacterium]